MSRWLISGSWLLRPFNLIRLCALLLVGCLLVLGSKYLRKVYAYTQFQQTQYASYQFHTLKNPTGIAYSPTLNFPANHDYLIIADTGNNVIRSFDRVGGKLTTIAGNGTAGYVDGALASAEFDHPTGIEVISHYVYGTNPYRWDDIFVSDSNNYVVRIFCLGNPYSVQDKNPKCPYNYGMDVGTYAGNHSKGLVNTTLLSSEFAHLSGVHTAIGYAIDADNHTIRGISGTGATTYAGTGTAGFVNGYRTSAQFNTPTKLTSGPGGLFISDAGNHVIRKIDASGNVTTFSGSGTSGYADGSPASARFVWPTSVAWNSSDSYFYVTDPVNNSIRRIDQSGNVTTYSGAPTSGLVNGTLSQARYSNPTDLVIVGGFMYVTDTNNNCVRRIDMNAGIVSTYIN